MAVIGNSATTQAFTPAVDYFSGNASTTAFTLSRPVASVAQVEAVIDNVVQNPSSAYTVSGNTITFTSAPLSGTNNIYVRYTSPITQVIAPGQGTVNTTALGNITNIASGNSSLTLQTGSSPTTAVTIDTSQNVGIGTSSPSSRLQVNSAYSTDTTPQTTILESGGGIGTAMFFGLKSDGTRWIMSKDGSTSTAYPMAFYTGTTERMRIDSSGNLLVGVTSPSGGFNTIAATGSNWALVAKNLSTSGSVYGFKSLLSYAPNNTSSYFIGCEDNGTGRMYVYSNGNVVNTNNSYGAISDRTLKENIVDASPKLENLCKVKIRNFNLIGETTKQLGVVAQELEEIFPSMVEADGNTQKKQVKYSVFVPMLVKAIQELKAINDQQAETINALTARIEALEAK